MAVKIPDQFGDIVNNLVRVSNHVMAVAGCTLSRGGFNSTASYQVPTWPSEESRRELRDATIKCRGRFKLRKTPRISKRGMAA